MPTGHKENNYQRRTLLSKMGGKPTADQLVTLEDSSYSKKTIAKGEGNLTSGGKAT